MSTYKQFIIESIAQDPTPENVELVFRTVRSALGLEEGRDLLAEVSREILATGSASMLRAVRKGDMEPCYQRLARSLGKEPALTGTVLVPRPTWLTTRGG